MHYPGHQKEDTEVAKENIPVDQAAKEAAKGTFIILLLPVLDLSQFYPEYSTADLEKDKSWGFEPSVSNHGSQVLELLKPRMPKEQS